MALLLAFGLGLGVGLLLKGVHIHITHKGDVEKPKEYNQSLAPMLPKNVQEYYQSTNGQNIY